MLKITILVLLGAVCCINAKAVANNFLPLPPFPQLPGFNAPFFPKLPTVADIEQLAVSSGGNSHGSTVSSHISSSSINGIQQSSQGGHYYINDNGNVIEGNF